LTRIYTVRPSNYSKTGLEYEMLETAKNDLECLFLDMNSCRGYLKIIREVDFITG
jgi:hypothetical protein